MFLEFHSDRQLTERVMKLKIGVLAGTPIFRHIQTDKLRRQRVDKLNSGKLDGIVMTNEVGGVGHNMVGACHMIFLGSLYSQSGENQAICTCRNIQADCSPHVS